MANNTELNTGPYIWGAAQNAAGQPDDTIARTGPDISRETFMDDTFRAFMLLYRSGVWHKGMNADLLDGQHADEFQPICATLTALCALSSYGLVAKTAANTIAARTITASATAGREGIAITNGDGVSGNPEVGLNISGLTADTTLSSTDEFPYRDATSEGNNKIDAGNLAAQLAVLGSYATTATAVTAASAFAAADRVIVADGADRSADDSDFTMSQNGTNAVDVASGTTFNIGGNVATSIILRTDTSVSGTLASGAHTITQETLGDVVRTHQSTATNDDPGTTDTHNRVATTNATATTLHTITLDTGKSYIVSAKVIGVVTTEDSGEVNTVGNTVGYHLRATLRNSAGTAIIVGQTSDAQEEATMATCACVFDATGATVRVRVTGPSNGASDTVMTWHLSELILSMPLGS